VGSVAAAFAVAASGAPTSIKHKTTFLYMRHFAIALCLAGVIVAGHASPRFESNALADRHDLARLTWEDEGIVTRRPPVQQFGPASIVPPPGAFLQATRQAEAQMQQDVARIVQGARRVLDLFAGCGTFTFPLARGAAVHSVEGTPGMIAALDHVNELEGELGVESVPDGGALFWFTVRFDVDDEALAAHQWIRGLRTLVVQDERSADAAISGSPSTWITTSSMGFMRLAIGGWMSAARDGRGAVMVRRRR